MSQYLYLPGREPGRPLPVASHLVAGGSKHGVDRGTVKASGLDLLRRRAAISPASRASRYGRGSDHA